MQSNLEYIYTIIYKKKLNKDIDQKVNLRSRLQEFKIKYF